MQITPLAVPDSWVCDLRHSADHRGSFREWFREDLLAAATGRSFRVAQANHSVSHRGVVRGVHYCDVPPGQAKLVYCVNGAIEDLVADLRIGSPTFGATATVTLSAATSRAVFLSEGLGHGFRALSDDTVVVYLMSHRHAPQWERAVTVHDPLFNGFLEASDAPELILSSRDAAAPPVAAAREQGLLPSYESCLNRYGELHLQSGSSGPTLTE